MCKAKKNAIDSYKLSVNNL